MSRIRDLHAGWMKDPAYRQEYDALEGELTLAAALVRARADAGLTAQAIEGRDRLVSRQGQLSELM